MTKVKKPTLKDIGTLKILKEVEEKWVRLDVEMSDSLINMLLEYADREMDEEERKKLFITWAFLDVVRKQMKKDKIKTTCCG